MTTALLSVWEWFLDENNRGAAIAIGAGFAAVVAGGWAAFVHFRRKPDVIATSNTNTFTADRGGVAVRDMHGSAITITPPAEPTKPHPDVQALADKAMKAFEDKGAALQQVQNLQQENRDLKAQLTAALERTEARADAGDPKARAAIEQTRATGDITQLDEVLDAEINRREGEIKEQAADWFELLRESAAIAFLRGDTHKAQSRLETIRRFCPNDLDAINLLGHIHHVRGRFDDAESCFNRVIDDPHADELTRADGLGSLALVRQARGDMNGAEQALRDALKRFEELNSRPGIAFAASNLGTILAATGDLDGAEQLHVKALAIYESLSLPMATSTCYGNLGAIERMCGRLDAAEQYSRKGLKVAEQFGWLEEIAAHYTNLGAIAKIRCDYPAAETMFRKALDAAERLDSPELIARCCGGIGVVLRIVKDFDGAQAMLERALTINTTLDHLQGMANDFGNLGNLLLERGDNKGAMSMHRKALSLHEQLNSPEGIATNLGNIALVMRLSGDLDGAEQMHQKASSLYQALDSPEGVARNYANLGGIEVERGKIPQAREFWTKAKDLYQQVGAADQVSQLQHAIDSLPAD